MSFLRIRMNITFLVLDLLFDIFDGVGAFHLKGDGFTCESLDKDLHPKTYKKKKYNKIIKTNFKLKYNHNMSAFQFNVQNNSLPSLTSILPSLNWFRTKKKRTK
jgi:hypothetical protein